MAASIKVTNQTLDFATVNYSLQFIPDGETTFVYHIASTNPSASASEKTVTYSTTTTAKFAGGLPSGVVAGTKIYVSYKCSTSSSTTFAQAAFPYPYKKDKTTLTLDYNGGTGSLTNPISYWGKTSSTTTFILPSGKPTRSGYSFLGWSTSSTATSASYSAGATVSLSGTKLYAVWKKLNNFTLSYNANNGSGAPSSQSSGDTTNSSYTFTISSTKPTRSGYSFSGWAESSSATSASYQPGGKITISANTTLYAVWQKTYSYTLSYDANGGSGAPSSQSSGTVTTSSYTFTVSSTSPTWSGHIFKGWGTSSTATTVSYNGGDSYTVSANKTLYAVWATTYKVSYDANGGSGAPSAQSQTSNAKSYTFTLSSTKPTRSGYKFLGWSTSSTATSASYQPGGSYTVSQSSYSKTLYAVWQKTYSYTLSYDANGGSGAPSAQSSGTVTTTSHTFTISSTVPTWSGSTFLGWADSSSATTASYQPGGKITVTANKTIYAVWEKSAPTIPVKVNGVWKNGQAKIKVNGTWKDATAVYVKVGGAWKKA